MATDKVYVVYLDADDYSILGVYPTPELATAAIVADIREREVVENADEFGDDVDPDTLIMLAGDEGSYYNTVEVPFHYLTK